MWVHVNIVESQQWTVVTQKKSKGKAKVSSNNVVGISTRKLRKMFLPSPVHEKRSLPWLLIQVLALAEDPIWQAVL